MPVFARKALCCRHMKLTFVFSARLVCLWVDCAISLFAASTKPPRRFERTVVLWPNGTVGKEDVDIPKLYVYPALGAGAHSAVIVLPGGGYRTLATEKEGGDVKAVDPVDRVSDRPDFAILPYARLTLDPSIPRKTSLEALIGTHATATLEDAVSLEQHVTKDTSPCFLFATTEDEMGNSMNSTTYYNSLKRAGVPAELHIFERGRHGIGMAQEIAGKSELVIYPTLVANWMQVHGWMPLAEGGKQRGR